MAFDPVASQSELFGLEQPGSAPPQKPGFDRAKLMRLIPLVAAAAKGGPGAIEGLLQGYQQAEAQKQQQAQQQATTQRQSMLDQSLLQDRAFSQDMRLAEFTQKQADARAKLMEAFTSATGELDNADDVRAVAAQYEQQGRPLGMRPGTFEHQAMIRLTPSTLERKAAEKKITALKSQFGVEKWMEQGAKFTHVVNGRTVPFTELLSMAGMTPDPNAPQAAPQSAIATDVPLDRQHAAALVSGNEALAKQIEDAMRRQDMAKSQPVDPQMAQLNRQIAEMRLENMRTAKDTTGLPPRVQRQVDAQAKGFDTQPVTKRVQIMAEAVSFVSALDPNSKNPADDQALIYAFAKAMDPDSVVREGEYATVQKYAQSWVESFGFNALRVLQNREFLTPQARANLKSTITARFAAAKQQYDNVRREYGRRINRLTGQVDGEDYLIDYGAAFPGGRSRSTESVDPGANPFRRGQ